MDISRNILLQHIKVTRLVPYLEPEQECVLVPREVGFCLTDVFVFVYFVFVTCFCPKEFFCFCVLCVCHLFLYHRVFLVFFVLCVFHFFLYHRYFCLCTLCLSLENHSFVQVCTRGSPKPRKEDR